MLRQLLSIHVIHYTYVQYLQRGTHRGWAGGAKFRSNVIPGGIVYTLYSIRSRCVREQTKHSLKFYDVNQSVTLIVAKQSLRIQSRINDPKIEE